MVAIQVSRGGSASWTIKDLGIIFEDSFKFEEHMSKIINNANSKLRIIKK